MPKRQAGKDEGKTGEDKSKQICDAQAVLLWELQDLGVKEDAGKEERQ